MKRLFIVAVACLSLTAVAAPAKKKSKQQQPAPAAAQNTGLANSSGSHWGMAGCGLGSILFGESESRLQQILASTTNGIYGNGTFGMSSGTSNCHPENGQHTAAVQKNMELFVAANREALANDIVKSNGDTLTAMSEIMGCKDQNYLGTTLQSHYETIFATKNEQEISKSMYETVSSDRYLLENCKL